jgi:hypothetical protein
MGRRLRVMGRRSRRREDLEIAQVRRPASRIARVGVDDHTWSEFRSVIGDRSVAEVLARYVELEVARARRQVASRDSVSERELVDVLERARTTAETLERIVRRLEVRLPRRD